MFIFYNVLLNEFSDNIESYLFNLIKSYETDNPQTNIIKIFSVLYYLEAISDRYFISYSSVSGNKIANIYQEVGPIQYSLYFSFFRSYLTNSIVSLLLSFLYSFGNNSCLKGFLNNRMNTLGEDLRMLLLIFSCQG